MMPSKPKAQVMLEQKVKDLRAELLMAENNANVIRRTIKDFEGVIKDLYGKDQTNDEGK